MSNEMKISYCIRCGAGEAGYLVALGNDRYKCKYCSSVFEKERADKETEKLFASILGNMEEAIRRERLREKEERIANYRHNLYVAINQENQSSEEIRKWADKVKEEIPDDFLARFYAVAVDKDVQAVNRFLDDIDVDAESDCLEDVLDFMLKTGEYGNVLSIEHLIDVGIKDVEKQTQYFDRIHDLAEKLKAGLYYTELPRDAFIAYSSKDFQAVNKLVTDLESKGLECFVAMRNLRHGKGAKENYITELEKAMRACKCFVFVSSRNSRQLDCDAVRLEIPYIREYAANKPRIEYLLDRYDHGKNAAEVMISDFFEGLSWCRDLDDLIARILRATELINAPIAKEQQKYCAHCLTANDPKAKFCIECGGTDFADTPAAAHKLYGELLQKEAAAKEAAAKEAAAKEAAAAAKPSEAAALDQSLLQGYGESLKEKLLADLREEMRKAEEEKAAREQQKAFVVKDGVAVKYTGKGGKVTLPPKTKAIGAKLFYGKKDITSVVIPDGVTSIGAEAFCMCEGLTELTIPSSVTTIEPEAFQYCYGLTSIVIPDSVTSLGAGAFFDCHSLTSVTIGKGVTEIFDSTFFYCRGLTEITIPEGVTTIGTGAFEECVNLTSVKLPSTLEEIEEGAFEACYKLVEVCDRSSLGVKKDSDEHGGVGFYAKHVYKTAGRSKLTTTKDGYILYKDGETISLLGYRGKETALTLPENVREIYDYAFYENRSLTAVTLSKGTMEIGAFAFAGCSALTSITYGWDRYCWSALIKGSNWDADTGKYTIHCADKDLAK